MSIVNAVRDAVSYQTLTLEAMIAPAEDAAGLRKAVKTLVFVQPLWVALGYERRAEKIAEKIRNRAAFLANLERNEGRDVPADLEDLSNFDAK